ncbi:MAG TPA: GNAT family N-acetyltransferase [Candidatus Dormibacteraeota bacterium]|jgi:acetyl coenzyme A synthetase (ADP forming)-like protein|nr:GNAT family N-acetyltransferase [Candidatus Dormibacteraeota bacterium]
MPLPPDYPSAWALDAVLADGGTVHIRPIRPDDADAHRAFFALQSEQNVYFRFFGPRSELSDREVTHFTTVDYHDRMAFVAFLRDQMIAVGRYDRLAGGDVAEVAFAVADEHQGRGLATLLLEYLAAYATTEGITQFAADTLIDNRRMLEVFQAAGFRRARRSIEYGVVHLTFDIEPTGHSLAASERRAWTAGVSSIARILQPLSVAVIGAGRNPQGIGHAVVRNLIDGGYTGKVYPVNPHVDELLGLACSHDVEAIDGPVDLAVLAIPAAQCIGAVDACGRKGVNGLVVISSGFAEVGTDGAELQRELLLRAHRGGMRVVGPNCFGVINTAPDVRLNATFASRAPIHGGIAFASQSGALGIAILGQSLTSGLGLSSFVSMGNKCDVSSNDLLRFWHQDGQTRAILLYLESFGNPRAFARVAPVVSRTTPIVVVKSGRSSAGTRAAASHTAALASPDTVVDALFRQAGVIRVDTLEELLDCGQLLANQPELDGHRLAIIGNAGGAAVLAADACEAAGLSVPEFDTVTQAALREIAGPNAGVSNPVDLGAGATPELFGEALRASLRSPSIDGAVVILAPVVTADAEDVARAVVGIDAGTRPIVFVHLGDGAAPAALSEGKRAVPCYAFPERAVRALGRIAEHSTWKGRPLGQVPALDGVDAGAASAITKAYLTEEPEGGWLAPDDAVAMLRAFGIATAGEVAVSSPETAAAAAVQLGGPVALKATGATILHKSDVGGVHLDLNTPDDVASAYSAMKNHLGSAMEGAIVQPMLSGVELIAGVISDPLFGPVVMFGSGGTAVELFGDRVLRILPLTDQDAHEMVRSIRGAPLLFGHRGAPACDVAAVEDVLLRVARLADAVPQVAEMDLNPLIASPSGAVAVDVRIRLAPWRRHAETEVRRLR